MGTDHLEPATWRPLDTSEEVWLKTRNRLRCLSAADKAHLCNVMSIDCERLARGGIAVTEPNATEDRIRFLLAQRRYGIALAESAFGPADC